MRLASLPSILKCSHIRGNTLGLVSKTLGFRLVVAVLISAFHCQEDGELRAREENRASLIVAICLASLILVILLVYGMTMGGRRIPYSNI